MTRILKFFDSFGGLSVISSERNVLFLEPHGPLLFVADDLLLLVDCVKPALDGRLLAHDLLLQIRYHLFSLV